ncbi:MAG: hypothetical protein KUG80_02150 [Gammaproteobacteria bacterium]|nr:hypothetical protein [Gammaproteobacteria bacterium]
MCQTKLSMSAFPLRDDLFIERRKPSAKFNAQHFGYMPRRGTNIDLCHTNNYVDWYSPSLLLVTILITLLSIFDSYITLHLMSMGATEENLLMQTAMTESIPKFISIKFALTELGLLFLVIHKNFILFKTLKIERLLHLVLFAYAILIIWETHLLRTIPAAF